MHPSPTSAKSGSLETKGVYLLVWIGALSIQVDVIGSPWQVRGPEICPFCVDYLIDND